MDKFAVERKELRRELIDDVVRINVARIGGNHSAKEFT